MEVEEALENVQHGILQRNHESANLVIYLNFYFHLYHIR